MTPLAVDESGLLTQSIISIRLCLGGAGGAGCGIGVLNLIQKVIAVDGAALRSGYTMDVFCNLICSAGIGQIRVGCHLHHVAVAVILVESGLVGRISGGWQTGGGDRAIHGSPVGNGLVDGIRGGVLRGSVDIQP